MILCYTAEDTRLLVSQRQRWFIILMWPGQRLVSDPHALVPERRCDKCQMEICTCTDVPQERNPKLGDLKLLWAWAHLPVFPFGEKDYSLPWNLSKSLQRGKKIHLYYPGMSSDLSRRIYYLWLPRLFAVQT